MIETDVKWESKDSMLLVRFDDDDDDDDDDIKINAVFCFCFFCHGDENLTSLFLSYEWTS